MILLGVFALFIYISTKLKLHIFDKNKSNNEKIILIPTFKNICLSLFAYILFGGLSTMAPSMLETSSPQNIIEFSRFNWHDCMLLSTEYVIGSR